MIRTLKSIIHASKVATIGAGAALADHFLDDNEKKRIDQLLLHYLREHCPNTANAAEFALCHDCNEYGYGYMLEDCVWAEALEHNKDDDEIVRFLCLWCVEERIGRPISTIDLTDAPINDPIRYILREKRPAREDGQ